MGIRIDQDLCNYIKSNIADIWPEKKIVIKCEPRSWQSNRYILVSTCLQDMGVHYEIYDNRIQFVVEEKLNNEIHMPFLRFIRERLPSNDTFQWRRCNNMVQGLCEIIGVPETFGEILEQLKRIINHFDPVIMEYAKKNPNLFQMRKDTVPNLSYKMPNKITVKIEEPTVKSIGNIPFDKFVIPPYQRPYKWTSKNVNQLITDILTFCAKNKEHYRLGTLVLFKNEKNEYEIVDGQQRIVTLTLLLTRILSEKLEDRRQKEYYSELTTNLKAFSNKTVFSNKYSLHNVVENIHTIDTRINDFDEHVLDFIVNKCEFVVIKLNDISEAFQFFDSQNARGKDLEPHDLLKAYHLREITDMTESDSENISFWQNQETSFLKEIFLTLYRAKRWSKGKSARYFTKSKVDIFKGVSMRDGKRYPFYQMEVIAHIFSTLYNNDITRNIDQRKINYPFNLDDQIINGSRFFDMICHYLNLYAKVKADKSYSENAVALKIIHLIDNYQGMTRTGDKYIKNMFYTAVLYYVDRFGWEEIDKVIPKYFIWAYTLRLKSLAVQLASVDDYATMQDSFLVKTHEAKTPYDVINISQDGLGENDIRCSKCDEIKNMFKELKKIYYDAQ